MTYIKTNSIRPEITKLLEESIGNTLIEVNLWDDALGYESKSIGNKNKIRDERIQKGFYTAKETINTVKCVTKEGEKIFVNYISNKGVNIENIYVTTIIR